jgi:hypothetical protein
MRLQIHRVYSDPKFGILFSRVARGYVLHGYYQLDICLWRWDIDINLHRQGEKWRHS